MNEDSKKFRPKQSRWNTFGAWLYNLYNIHIP